MSDSTRTNDSLTLVHFHDDYDNRFDPIFCRSVHGVLDSRPVSEGLARSVQRKLISNLEQNIFDAWDF